MRSSPLPPWRKRIPPSLYNGVTLLYPIGLGVGTALGAVICSVLPELVQNAMGIALYAMFIALVVPGAKSRAVLAVVAIAVTISSLFTWAPWLEQVSAGWSTIIATLAACLAGAIFFPRRRFEMYRILAAVLLMALVTYIPRALPMTFFKKRLTSRFIRSFLYYVPYAALGAMTFPAILYSTGDLTSALFGMAVALVLAFYEKGLLIVALSAIAAVFLSQILL